TLDAGRAAERARTGLCRLTRAGIVIGGRFFFFSSRRRHTRFKCDWSSDVCSSDLDGAPEREEPAGPGGGAVARRGNGPRGGRSRSEERRVGKECRSPWARWQ